MAMVLAILSSAFEVIGTELRVAGEAAAELARCCRRRSRDVATGRWRFRGLRRLEQDRVQTEKQLRKQQSADASDRGAITIEVVKLGGSKMKVPVASQTTGRQLRARVAEFAGAPAEEIVLVCGASAIRDEELLLRTRGEALRGPPPHAQFLRVKRQLALSGSSNRLLQLWDLAGESCVSSLSGHHGRVCCVEVDWPSKRALSGSVDGLLKLWDLDSGLCVETFGDLRSSVRSLGVDWAARRAVASDVANLKIWDLDSAKCIATLHGQHDIQCIAVHWASGRAVAGSSDGMLILWDLVRHVSRPSFEHMAWVAAVALNPAATIAVSGSIDGALKLWDFGPFVCTRTLSGQWGDVRCLSVHWETLRVITGTECGELKLWDFRDNRCVGSFLSESGVSQSASAVALAAAAQAAMPAEAAELPGRGLAAVAAAVGGEVRFQSVSCVVVDWPACRAMSGCSTGEVRLWDLREGGGARVIGSAGGEVKCLALAPGEPCEDAEIVVHVEEPVVVEEEEEATESDEESDEEEEAAEEDERPAHVQVDVAAELDAPAGTHMEPPEVTSALVAPSVSLIEGSSSATAAGAPALRPESRALRPSGIASRSSGCLAGLSRLCCGICAKPKAPPSRCQ
eukprot:TRINITY_DN28927_c0_g1_i1.p1 TRINITY_DN28927_c0_g1~~TRINITY_DN28927_c0_g1_i1.p1  ORF type:complete len:626 (-),score=134.29 TRINITY_DN28927_c0_g1_i1:65-1942(-)